MKENSRADYMKSRREKYKMFSVEIEREKMNRFETVLNKKQVSKSEWLNKKIDEEISE